MINLTNQQFNVFCQIMDIENGLMIMTKALFTIDGDNILAFSPIIGHHGDEFKNIVAVKSEDFNFSIWTNSSRPTYLTWVNENIPSSSTGQMTFDSSTNYFKFSPSSRYFNADSNETVEFVIVYCLDDNVTLNATNIFTNVDLVSIDYVGNKINEIGFLADFPHLKEINLYNNLHYKYDGLQSVNEQTLNFADGFNVTSSNPNILLGNYNNITLSPGAFAGSPIKKMVFPNSLTPYTIPANCFAGCKQLQEVYIPDSVTAIGANAFNGCNNLKYIYIGANVVTIETGAFDGCVGIGYYDQIIFETSVNNTRFVGERGCLLRKNITSIDGESYMVIGGNPWYVSRTDNTYTAVHMTNCWFNQVDSRWCGISECKYVSYLDFPSGFSMNKPNYGMMLINGGGGSEVTDIHGNVYTNCTRVTSGNYDTIYASHSTIGQDFLVPIYYLIEAIEENACINDPWIGLGKPHESPSWAHDTIYFSDPREAIASGYDLITWYSLKYIGKNAFKGCRYIQHIVLPTNSTDDYGHTGVRGSLYGNIYLDNSAFENCVYLQNLNITKTTYFANKVFFGCTRLTDVNFGNYPPATMVEFNEADGTYTPGANGNPSAYNIGYLTFGNTPSLQNITCSVQTNTIQNNAIMAIDSNFVLSGILVGCKSTDLSVPITGSNKIYEGAFYGCSQMTVSSGSSSPTQFLSGANIKYIGRNAFYGCVSLVSRAHNSIEIPSGCYIYEKAFYGCSGIEYLLLEHGNDSSANNKTKLYSKAFANSGVKYINIVRNRVELMDYDVFDGCVLNSVNVNTPTEQTNQLIGSSAMIENALISRLGTYTSRVENLAIVQSGDGKDIVNTVYTSNNIYEIKSGAFNGVIMNNGDNTLIHIPKTVNQIGSNILAGSKTVNSQGQTITNCGLKLDGDTYYVENSIQNIEYMGELSVGLLYYVGGRYFRNIVETTVSYYGQYHCYCVKQVIDENSHPMLILNVIDSGGNSIITNILTIGYNSNNDIILKMKYALDCDYMNADNDAHVHAIEGITLVLMYSGQSFTPDEINVYCDPYLVPGSKWLEGTDLEIIIPEDIPEGESMAFYPYLLAENGAFSNCKWVNKVASNRLLSNLYNGFKGCTNLLSITAARTEPQYNIDLSIFNGSVPNGMFDGCTNFIGVIPYMNNSLIRRLVIYGDNSFNDCYSFSDREMLMYGTKFGKKSFANTGLDVIDLVSVGDDNDIYHGLDPQAFNGCRLSYATANSTCGYYFTGADNASIIDKNKKLIVGSSHSDISNYNEAYNPNFLGIGSYAFYGRDFIWGSQDEEIWTNESFTIGESAFSTSTIVKWLENEHIAFDGISGIKNYGQNAFKDCVDLTQIIIYGNVILGEGIFEGCTSLSDAFIELDNDIPAKCFAKCTSLPSFICSGSIGENAFNGCSSLSNLYLHYYGRSNITVAPTAFIGCPISRIHTEDDEESVYTDNGILLDTYNVFKCNNDGHIELVVGCSQFNTLTSVIDNRKWKIRLKVIGKHAFNGRGLEGEITIPGSVTKIDDYAFANNPGITYVSIPPTVEYIGAHAFDGCTNLISVTLPDSCTFIGEGAFKGCSLSQGFNCNTEDKRYYTPITIQTSEFSPTFETFNGSIDLTNAPYTTISPNCFKDTGIKIIRLPKRCNLVSNSAFYGCTQLAEFHFTSPHNTVNIHDSAFYGCTRLSDIYLDNEAFPHINNANVFDGMGDDVPNSQKHIHAPASFENYPAWLNSDMYLILTGNKGYNVQYDL